LAGRRLNGGWDVAFAREEGGGIERGNLYFRERSFSEEVTALRG